MIKAFELVGLSKADVEERFGGLYRAFQYGAPPHGGMAAGIDRMVMLLCGAQNLREITLFPMNQRAEDLLMRSEEHTSELQSLMRISYAVFCLKKNKHKIIIIIDSIFINLSTPTTHTFMFDI